jgi:hypothetical protein
MDQAAADARACRSDQQGAAGRGAPPVRLAGDRQEVQVNPTGSVRGTSHAMRNDKTPVLAPEEVGNDRKHL